MEEPMNICRTCLSKDEHLIPLNSVIEKENTKEITIFELYEIYMNLKLYQDDILPKHVCQKCVNRLIDIKDYHIQIQDAENYLNLCISNNQFKNVENPFINKNNEHDVMDKIFNGLDSSDDLFSGMGDFLEFEPLIEAVLNDQQENNSDEKYGQKITADCICRKCNDSFKNKKLLKLHEKHFHSSPEVLTKSKLKPPTSTLNSSHLLIAQNSSDSESEVIAANEKNSYKSHKDLKSDHKIRIKEFQCKKCDEIFATRTLLSKHFMETHSHDPKTHLCQDCGKQFTSDRNLRTHIWWVHKTKTSNDDKKFKCENCGKKFSRNHYLIAHLKTHNSGSEFKCEECNKYFAAKNSLETHMSLHIGKGVECSVCKKKLAKESHLKLHMRMHSNERPYECYLCGKTYKQSSHLKGHIKKQHIEEKIVKSFQCENCDKTFNCSKSLKKHKIDFHFENGYQCPKCNKKFTTENRKEKHMKIVHRALTSQHDTELDDK